MRSRRRRWNANEEPAVGKRGGRDRADFKYKRLTLMLFARGLYENGRLNNSIFELLVKSITSYTRVEGLKKKKNGQE